MIHVSNLHKAYGSTLAVNGVSFDIARGEVFGLLGPNGAGKSTTLHMLVGVLRPDSGTIVISDQGNPADAHVRSVLGIAPQALALYDELSAEANLRFFGRMYGLSGARLRERVDWALELAELTPRRSGRVGTFSGGMKRRLNLAAALVHEPQVVLLDEPTAGVDPQSRNHIFDQIEKLRAEGLTVLYTTHYMEEAQRLCDRVAIMDKGVILAVDTVEGLVAQHGGASVITAELERVPEDVSALCSAENGLGGRLEDNQLRIDTMKPMEDVARLSGMGLKLHTLAVQRPDLETVFLTLTGRSLRD